MFSLFLATLQGAIALSGPPPYLPSEVTEQVITEAFEEFVVEFKKSYSDQEKEAKKAIFEDNFKAIVEENAQGHPYTLGINEFADLTQEHFASVYLSSMGEYNVLKYSNDPFYLGPHEPTGEAVPDSIDWEQKGAVAEVKNQGQCGSCWSFSTTGALEGRWEIATGKLTELSEQQLVDCSSKYGNMGCNGGIMDFGFKYIHDNGVCSEEDYEYDAVQESCKASKCTPVVPKGAVTGFKDVHPKDKQALMEAVASGPVSIAIEADEMTFQFYHDGVLTAKCGSKLDHGVLLVGYGTLDGTPFWKVKNSWGTQWGKNGYILLSRAMGGAGECGILLQASYPVVKSAGDSSDGSHYEKPPCQSDEMAIAIQQAPGKGVCAPKCDQSGQCPSDAPAGGSATPQCALQSQQGGDKYCALICQGEGSCGGGATCVALQGALGICMYDMKEEVDRVEVEGVGPFEKEVELFL